MTEKQNLQTIEPDSLIVNCLELNYKGYRLVQICATRYDDRYELTYTFDLNGEMLGLRFSIGKEDEIASISSVYSYAFLYENELKDLFGIRINLITLDYNGNLYRTGVRTPFDTPKGE